MTAPAATSALAQALSATQSMPLGEPTGGRQVSTRGTWAEFQTLDCRTYYVNILTLEKQWQKPPGWEMSANRRPGQNSGMGHSNVYVGNLPKGCHDVMFRQLVEPHGPIISLKMMPSKKAGGNDYGFVKYVSVEVADHACKQMNGMEVNGCKLIVKFAAEDKKF